MTRALRIKPINLILVVAIIGLSTFTVIYCIQSQTRKAQLIEQFGDLTIHDIESRILAYQLADSPDSAEADSIRDDMLAYVATIQDSSPDIASGGRVILGTFLTSEQRYLEAIDVLESDLQYEVSPEARYIVYGRLIDIYEQTHQPESERRYLHLLLSMEDVHPQYESWDVVKDYYQAKLDALEVSNE